MFLTKIQEQKKSKKKTTKYDDQKLDTKEITFLLYNDGNSIDDIANERGLTTRTICRHLEYYIAEGDIEVTDFVPGDEIKIIAKTVKELNTKSLALLKEQLPDCDYQNIRFVLAAMENQSL
ncbi:MAG: helix-turn-helix domain-containing protein [Bacteroidales bacterium]|nr:helix-turn-helix domain-containing protein [Bacteroidales bacterium]